jgi:hypothetical protein
VKLLTPSEVADILSVSVRTVMRHSRALGGFYPAGIRALRFLESDVLSSCRGGMALPQVVTRPDGKDPNRHGV